MNEGFVRAHTAVAAAPGVPEVRLHLATELTPLWHATAEALARAEVPPPFWAFPWGGGQVLARLLLDEPERVRGRRVLDLACGSGIVGIAAALAGAAHVRAVDIDPFAAAATRLNAALNGVAVDVTCDDIVGDALPDVDLVLCGDVCYEAPMAARLLGWLRRLDVEVWIGDPGRAHLPFEGVETIARRRVPVLRELEGVNEREGVVVRLVR